MEREYKLFGRGLDEKEAEAAAEVIDRRREESVKPIEGELEKTPEEIKFINLCNSYLQQEFEELGIKEKPEILPEQIHLFSHKDFVKKFPWAEAESFHESQTTKAAYFDKEAAPNRLHFYKAILHDIIHIISFHKYLVDVEKKEYSSYRTGYTIRGVRKEDQKDDEHLRWFNEAVVDKITQDILVKHRDELYRELNITPEEEKETVGVYYPRMDALNAIIDEIAKRKGEGRPTVWQKIKRGQFSGEMMHLRDIEKYLGKGTLKIVTHWHDRIETPIERLLIKKTNDSN